MAGEVYTFNEGSAYFWTGGAGVTSALAAYVQNATVQISVTYTAYKPPHATRFTQYPYASGAQLTIGQLYSNPTLGLMFDSATGGIHVHLKHVINGLTQTGGLFLYSGYLGNYTLGEQRDAAITEGLQGAFPTWTRY